MDLAFLVSLVGGVLAAIGLIGIIGGASFARRKAGQRAFLVGSMAMAAAGAVVMVSSFAGITGAEQLFGGLMMLIFGTAVSLPKQGDQAMPDVSTLST